MAAPPPPGLSRLRPPSQIRLSSLPPPAADDGSASPATPTGDAAAPASPATSTPPSKLPVSQLYRSTSLRALPSASSPQAASPTRLSRLPTVAALGVKRTTVSQPTMRMEAVAVQAMAAARAGKQSAAAPAAATTGAADGVIRQFKCQRVIDATQGERGVRCMAMVEGTGTVWGGSRDGFSIEVRSIKTGAFVKRLKHPDESIPQKVITEKPRLDVVALLVVGGRHVWSGSADGVIRIWDWQTETCVKTFKAHTGSVDRMILSPDGNVWTMSNDFTIKLWHGRSHFLVLTLLGHSNWVRCAAQIDQQLWSGSDDGTIRLWDIKGGAQVGEIAVGDGVLAMCLVGRRLWVGCRDNRIRIYDVDSRELVLGLSGHRGWVTVLEYVGGHVWSGSSDHTLCVWDTSPPKLVQRIEGFRGWMYSIATMGTVLWASCSDRKIRVYGVTEIKRAGTSARAAPAAAAAPVLSASQAHSSAQTDWSFSAGQDVAFRAHRSAADGSGGESGHADVGMEEDGAGAHDEASVEEEDEEEDDGGQSQLQEELALKNEQLEALHRSLREAQAALARVSEEHVARAEEDKADWRRHNALLITVNETLTAQVRSLQEDVARLRAYEEHILDMRAREADRRSTAMQTEEYFEQAGEDLDLSFLAAAPPDSYLLADEPLLSDLVDAETQTDDVKVDVEKAPTAFAGTQTEEIERTAMEAQTEEIERTAMEAQTELIERTAMEAQTDAIESATMMTMDVQTDAIESATIEAQTEEIEHATMGAQTEDIERTAMEAQTEERERATADVDVQTVSSESASLHVQTVPLESFSVAAQTDAVERDSAHVQTAAVESASVDVQTAAVESASVDVQTAPTDAADAETQTALEEASEEAAADADAAADDSDSEAPLPAGAPRTTSIVSFAPSVAEEALLLKCTLCHRRVPIEELPAHARTCAVTTRSVNVDSDSEDMRTKTTRAATDLAARSDRLFGNDAAFQSLEAENASLQAALAALSPTSADDYLRALELKDRLIRNLIQQKVSTMMKAASFSFLTLTAEREIERLNLVLHTHHMEEKFASEEAFVRAVLGDLAIEKLGKISLAGWLQKRSDHLKKWNRRFFVLIDKFLIYYVQKRKGQQPRQVCVLNNAKTNRLADAKHPFAFSVATPRHEYILAAATEAECGSWLEAIGSAANWWMQTSYVSARDLVTVPGLDGDADEEATASRA